MRRISEQILELLHSAEEVESSFATHGPGIGARLDERFAPRIPNLDEIGPPSFPAVIEGFRLELAASREALKGAEALHLQSEMALEKARTKFNKLAPGIKKEFSALRRTVEDLYEEEDAVDLVGIQGPTAVRPFRLLRQAELGTGNLLRPDLELPTPRFEVELSPVTMAANLRPKVEGFRSVHTTVKLKRRAADETRKAMHQAMADHKETFLWIARAGEGLYRLAGEDELAERIRPSLRRTGRRKVDVAPDADGETPDADEATDDPTADDGASPADGPVAATPTSGG